MHKGFLEKQWVLKSIEIVFLHFLAFSVYEVSDARHKTQCSKTQKLSAKEKLPCRPSLEELYLEENW